MIFFCQFEFWFAFKSSQLIRRPIYFLAWRLFMASYFLWHYNPTRHQNYIFRIFFPDKFYEYANSSVFCFRSREYWKLSKVIFLKAFRKCHWQVLFWDTEKNYFRSLFREILGHSKFSKWHRSMLRYTFFVWNASKDQLRFTNSWNIKEYK